MIAEKFLFLWQNFSGSFFAFLPNSFLNINKFSKLKKIRLKDNILLEKIQLFLQSIKKIHFYGQPCSK